MTPRSTLIIALAGIALSGCASPRYQTSQRLEAPIDPAGQACAANCEQTRCICQADCQEKFNACARDVEPQAQARHQREVENYGAALDEYRAGLDRYRFDLWLSHGQPHFHAGLWWHDAWFTPTYPPPSAPRKPSLERTRAEVLKEKCREDYACAPTFESCVMGCGGRRVSETRCVANCPDEGKAPATPAGAER